MGYHFKFIKNTTIISYMGCMAKQIIFKGNFGTHRINIGDEIKCRPLMIGLKGRNQNARTKKCVTLQFIHI
jgi:hypothetical protein